MFLAIFFAVAFFLVRFAMISAVIPFRIFTSAYIAVVMAALWAAACAAVVAALRAAAACAAMMAASVSVCQDRHGCACGQQKKRQQDKGCFLPFLKKLHFHSSS